MESTSATARTATPSPRPIQPMPSLVFPLIETWRGPGSPAPTKGAPPGVGHGMGIRMAAEPRFARDFDAAQDETPARFEPVRVVPDADAHAPRPASGGQLQDTECEVRCVP